MLKKVTTKITYRVPAGPYCNIPCKGHVLKPSSILCRFCVKDKNGYKCVLHDTPLTVESGNKPIRIRDCVKASVGYKSQVEDVEENTTPQVEPQQIIKMALDEYDKVRKQLLNQGYPETMASKVARDYMLGGA